MGKVFLLYVRATPSGEFKLYKQSSRIHVSIKVHLEYDDSKRKATVYITWVKQSHNEAQLAIQSTKW